MLRKVAAFLFQCAIWVSDRICSQHDRQTHSNRLVLAHLYDELEEKRREFRLIMIVAHLLWLV